MLSRTTASLVTFVHPFVMAGYNGDLPPDSREIFAGNKGLQSLSFAACRGTSRHQFIK